MYKLFYMYMIDVDITNAATIRIQKTQAASTGSPITTMHLKYRFIIDVDTTDAATIRIQSTRHLNNLSHYHYASKIYVSL